MSRATVVIELAGPLPIARDLAAGGVFLPRCALRLADECDLVVRGATQQLRIPARVVYVDPRGGAGLEILGFTAEMKAQLAGLASEAPARVPMSSTVVPIYDDDLEIPLAEDLDDAAGDDDGDTIGDRPGVVIAGHDLAGAVSAHLAQLDVDPLDPPTEREPARPPHDAAEDVVDGALEAEAAALAPPAVNGDDPADVDAVELPSVGAATLDDLAPMGASASPARAFPVARAAARVTRSAPLPIIALDAEHDLADRDSADDEQADAQAAHDAAPTEDAGDVAADEAPEDALDIDGEPAIGRRPTRSVHERLRGLTLAAQVKMAGQGELHERIMLERLYGKNVWETLLRNPRLTAPEVSRIARYGALPRVLIDIIVGNSAWLQIPEVRRALLSNPRLATDHMMKVLRVTPRHELRLAATQTAYPHGVRQAAKLLLRND